MGHRVVLAFKEKMENQEAGEEEENLDPLETMDQQVIYLFKPDLNS